MDAIEMTEAELTRLRAELDELEGDGRHQMAARIKTAREWGDLKENAEYHAAKEAQAHLETKIARLREQLRAAVLVAEPATVAAGLVRHGATVTVTDLSTEKEQTFTIVSPNDARPAEGHISSASPVAQALVGHRLGEVATVATPKGQRRLRIDTIA
ncbi:transcription elongation factor GreA [Conexibacter sp. DBS9H8]|uniref:transcription elongation factor GreA n=1 Tax=Conexibacter sp. DBS9H8 TaxID=2937801 RepID=UPI00200F0474|nr:transcription elongation factor GreA [Conexibacter sp. DBS9H8]